MGRRIPLMICFVAGILMVIQFFTPPLRSVYEMVLDWYIVILVFALAVGLQTTIYLHVNKVRRRVKGYLYSLVTLVSLVSMATIGLAGGIRQGSWFMWLFEHIQVPLGATMFALLAFFMASAAYRAFRARTLEATLLLVAAVIVMLGRVPIGYFLTKGLPESIQIPAATEWILMYPNMAAKRGIMFGVALGMISTALKVIVGIERGYLGGRR
ncbi:hypothetical protein AMJ40_03315 [candidate division TA06 bacterium DG_26]|uniref:Uncharacterized protein n=1 Tax=candidate division TA06 bacterium DG_26 TaxID=1703771 RepID=A0A0S7WJA9_UNCT6|nr:MAG: hypothetical protein AMJ40_03315 [candidate division TA06 bacterium DG_26]